MRLEHLLSGAPDKKGAARKRLHESLPSCGATPKFTRFARTDGKFPGTSDKTMVIAFCNESPTKTLFNETHYRKDITQKSREGAEEWTVL